MTEPELAPRSAVGGIVVVWVCALLVAVAVGLFAPPAMRAAWLAVGFGGCLLFAFVAQLWFGRVQGFIDRVALGALGALLVMGLVSAVFGLVAMVPA